MIRLTAVLLCTLGLLGLSGCGGFAIGDLDVAAAARLFEQRQFAEAIPHSRTRIEQAAC